MAELRSLLESLTSTHHLANILPATFLKVDIMSPNMLVTVPQEQTACGSEDTRAPALVEVSSDVSSTSVSSDRSQSLCSNGDDKFSSSSGSVQQSPPSELSPAWPSDIDKVKCEVNDLVSACILV